MRWMEKSSTGNKSMLDGLRKKWKDRRSWSVNLSKWSRTGSPDTRFTFDSRELTSLLYLCRSFAFRTNLLFFSLGCKPLREKSRWWNWWWTSSKRILPIRYNHQCKGKAYRLDLCFYWWMEREKWEMWPSHLSLLLLLYIHEHPFSWFLHISG